MGKGKTYPEKRDIRAIAVLLATQGMIRLGEIPDPLNGQAALDAEGARFFIDLLQELQRKTRGNLLPDEAAFLERCAGKHAARCSPRKRERKMAKKALVDHGRPGPAGLRLSSAAANPWGDLKKIYFYEASGNLAEVSRTWTAWTPRHCLPRKRSN